MEHKFNLISKYLFHGSKANKDLDYSLMIQDYRITILNDLIQDLNNTYYKFFNNKG